MQQTNEINDLKMRLERLQAINNPSLIISPPPKMGLER
jgi:hypothetical protein